jgi:YidC/Oxa1 family membrane protein insertase
LDITSLWNAAVVLPLEAVLKFLADLTGSAGLAIILMTVLIKTVLLPLSMKQTASMKSMQALQPEIAELKKRYKNDREKVTQETMRLYKERGVNPAAGCLPMVPMMVILFGLYWALQNLSNQDEAFQQPFLWVPNLHTPDVIHLGEIPLPGLLPIMMAITQYFSSKMMTMPTQDPQQQMMNRMTTVMMPAMMLFWGVTFPAGLVLYWFVSNVFEMVRLYFAMGPQSLGIGSFSPASLLPGRAAKVELTATDGSSGPSADQTTNSEDSGGGAPSEKRSSRSRQKRGRRSGRR